MMSVSSTVKALAFALLALGATTVWGQSAAAEAAREKARDVQTAKQKASAQRDAMLAEFEALARQLKDANAEQRKQILEKIEQHKKAFEEAQSALHKQIRDEQRRQRQSGAPRR